MSARRGWLLACLGLTLLLVLYLGEIGGYPLQDPDEGRYAEIPREMVESGDWVTPRLNYVVYFEKPPLLYWLVGLSFQVFGLSAAAARAVPALAGVLTVVMTFLLGRRLLGMRAALLGAGVLATSPIFFVLAQALTIDTLLTACVTATLACLYGAHVAGAKSVWTLLVAISAALGVLAKGLVALVLPGLIAVVFLVARRDWPTLRALLRPLPIAAFLLVSVPWFVFVAQANSEFLHFFFVREHLQRFTADVGHPEGPFYYVPVLLLGPLPWTAAVLGLVLTRPGRQAWREIPAEARLFLSVWGGLVIAFFTVASSKLAPYILPGLPPLALLAGGLFDRALARERLAEATVRGVALGMLGLGLLALATAAIALPMQAVLAERFGGDAEDVASIIHATVRAGVAFGITGFLVRRARHRRQIGLAAAYGALVVGMGLAVFGALPARAVVKTSREMARAIDAEYRDGDLVVLYRKLWQGVPFYTQRRVAMIRNYDEVWHGVSVAPDRAEYYWDDLEPLAEAWASGRRVFVLTNADLVPEVAGRVSSAPRELARDRRRVVVVNFPPGDGDGADTAVRKDGGPGLPGPSGG